jgi:hypothetical protein
MRILDKHWPWQFLAAALFIGVMAGLRFMMKGVNEDFGVGFALGLMVGGIIVLAAVGWRRGEHRHSAEAVRYPPSRL